MKIDEIDDTLINYLLSNTYLFNGNYLVVLTYLVILI
jgi:hypothetical protein